MKNQDSGNEYKVRFTVEKMFILPDAGNLMAFVDVTINDLITIRGARVVRDSKAKMKVQMPMEQGKDGKWYDQVMIRDSETCLIFARTVLKEYSKRSGIHVDL